MPYRWSAPDRLELWPHQALSRRGFARVIAGFAGLGLLPLAGVLGTGALWGLLPFLGLALAGLWWGLRRNARDREIREVLETRPGLWRLQRLGPGDRRAQWQGDPFWLELRLHATGGPVPDYLTLRGGGRRVEIGAFLSPAERRALAQELRRKLPAK
ncbi:DUF2244 domain-containing protein [Pseudooceanicola sp. CBS1P-1]|uniref:DUF2244 domain-containing protein n=1 Tax=Pseudooceanicola albus TaxID=2692189 RepID=A0A6L7G6B3_9RHOB|nr:MULTISPECIES: DUF2244 domain-containing protein [Pseudooceanicola]MBT9385550.1 DUF2244 domain-containing protein [Pseudooceanicola endophyticus]MXN19038.1 DUF2244 domain-containing protein [Pseudooceanicola albus]